MKNFSLSAAAAFFLLVSCKTATNSGSTSKFNYDDLYNKVWVVDTIILLGAEVVSTPNIETDKNEYQFRKEGSKGKQGTRTTITSEARIDVPYTIKDGVIHFEPAATFPLLKFDENGKLVESNMFASLPPYKIIALSPGVLHLRNDDILMKLKVK